MSSLFNESTTEKIKSIRKTFLWTAVCILIGEVIVGAILILAQSFNGTIGRLMSTFALCALALFIGVNNFSRMEKGEKLVQGFALAGFIANIIWLLLATLFIWEVMPLTENYYSSRMTVMSKIMVAAIDAAIMCFFVSNVWSIEETVKPVRPLKITAIVCEIYCGTYAIIVTLGDIQTTLDSRWNALAGLAALAFIVMACAASIVSNSGKKKAEKATVKAPQDSPEMQAAIKEMIEKEVQQRLAAEKAETEHDAVPPLQDENMQPTVSRDNEVKLDTPTIDTPTDLNDDPKSDII